MSCSLCEITQMLSDKHKDLDPARIDLIARRIFERVSTLGFGKWKNFDDCVSDIMSKQGYSKEVAAATCAKIEKQSKQQQGPEGEAGSVVQTGALASCVTKMKKEKGMDDDQARMACSKMGKNKESKESKELDLSDLMRPLTNPLLIQYRETYKEMMMVQLQPLNNMMEFKRVEKQVWAMKDKLYELERAYANSGTSDFPDEDLMIAKIQAQKEIKSTHPNLF